MAPNPNMRDHAKHLGKPFWLSPTQLHECPGELGADKDWVGTVLM